MIEEIKLEIKKDLEKKYQSKIKSKMIDISKKINEVKALDAEVKQLEQDFKDGKDLDVLVYDPSCFYSIANSICLSGTNSGTYTNNTN